MKLGDAWDELRDEWGEARIRVTLEEPERTDRAAQLLGPLQPFRAGPAELSFRVVGNSGEVRRLLERLDAERIHGSARGDLVGSSRRARAGAAGADLARILAGRARRRCPPDWSDLLAEVELTSSDWIDRASVNMVPLNPRRDGITPRLPLPCGAQVRLRR